MRARVARLTAVSQALLLMATMILPALANGAVWTDQADYAPGSVVTIGGDNSNGAGYLPGETIGVAVTGPNGYTAACAALTDDLGAWSCQITLWSSADAVGDYSYVAIGQISGASETGTFTDATNVAATLDLALSTSTITLGNSVSLSGSLVATSSGDPAVPAGQTVHLNRYSGLSCPNGGATLVANATTTNPGGTFGPETFTPASSGTFYFKAVFDGSDNGLGGSNRINWQPTASDCVQLTVNPAPATITTTTTASDVPATFGAASVTLNASVTPASGPTVNSGSVTFTVNGVNVTDDTIVAGAASASLSLAGFNVGAYNVSATYTPGSGFSGSNNAGQSPTPKLTIGQASSTTTVTCDAGPFTYSGSPIEPCTYTVTGAGGLNLGPTDIPAANYANNVNAGSASASFTYGGDTNHTGSNGSTNFSIDKADPNCSVTGYDVTYDANPHTATGSCVGVTGEPTPLAAIDLSGTTHTNAGSYATDRWSFTDTSGNYNDASGTVDDTIDKADADCSFPDYTIVYDGAFHGALGSCTGVDADGAALGSSVDLGASFKFVPGGTAHWVFTGGTNYNDESGDTEITITTGFRIDGFYQPVDMSSHTSTTRMYNSVKGGQTVPLKFRVFTLAGTEVTSTTGISVIVETVSCVSGPLDPVLLPTDATGGTELRYAGGNFIFNWAVPKKANICYEVTVQTPDHASQMSYSGVQVDAFFRSK